jgi:hypothetical protein
LPSLLLSLQKDDLTDVAGIKQLVATPKEQKAPRNELADLKGVRYVLITSRGFPRS